MRHELPTAPGCVSLYLLLFLSLCSVFCPSPHHMCCSFFVCLSLAVACVRVCQAVCQTAAFPERLSPLLARVVQGSPSPLSKLSEEAAEVMRSSIPQQAAGLTVEQIAAKIRSDQSPRGWFLLPMHVSPCSLSLAVFFTSLSLSFSISLPPKMLLL